VRTALLFDLFPDDVAPSGPTWEHLRQRTFELDQLRTEGRGTHTLTRAKSGRIMHSGSLPRADIDRVGIFIRAWTREQMFVHQAVVLRQSDSGFTNFTEST